VAVSTLQLVRYSTKGDDLAAYCEIIFGAEMTRCMVTDEGVAVYSVVLVISYGWHRSMIRCGIHRSLMHWFCSQTIANVIIII